MAALSSSLPRVIPRRPFRLASALACALLFGGAGGSLRAQPAQEYQVKAVFLLNFAQFVEWPTSAFPAPQSPLIVGVLGNDPFGVALEEAVRGEKVRGHPLVIQRFRRPQDVRECHILFVATPEDARLETALPALPARHVLIVGDGAEFAQRGGTIGFRTENNKIRLRINLAAARSADLTISSKLLRAAELVGPTEVLR